MRWLSFNFATCRSSPSRRYFYSIFFSYIFSFFTTAFTFALHFKNSSLLLFFFPFFIIYLDPSIRHWSPLENSVKFFVMPFCMYVLLVRCVIFLGQPYDFFSASIRPSLSFLCHDRVPSVARNSHLKSSILRNFP